MNDFHLIPFHSENCILKIFHEVKITNFHKRNLIFNLIKKGKGDRFLINDIDQEWLIYVLKLYHVKKNCWHIIMSCIEYVLHCDLWGHFSHSSAAYFKSNIEQ